jgi:putative tryptophan/tyrosine transport system substrate-binding protein
VRRREFIAGLGGAAAWPVVSRAQQPNRIRRVGVLMGWSEADPEYRAILAAFIRELSRLGWSDGGNISIEQRWTDAQIDRTQAFAKELVELNPDVILCCTTPVTAALQRETRTIPIVFTVITDSGLCDQPFAAGGQLHGIYQLRNHHGR